MNWRHLLFSIYYPITNQLKALASINPACISEMNNAVDVVFFTIVIWCFPYIFLILQTVLCYISYLATRSFFIKFMGLNLLCNFTKPFYNCSVLLAYIVLRGLLFTKLSRFRFLAILVDSVFWWYCRWKCSIKICDIIPSNKVRIMKKKMKKNVFFGQANRNYHEAAKLLLFFEMLLNVGYNSLQDYPVNFYQLFVCKPEQYLEVI